MKPLKRLACCAVAEHACMRPHVRGRDHLKHFELQPSRTVSRRCAPKPIGLTMSKIPSDPTDRFFANPDWPTDDLQLLLHLYFDGARRQAVVITRHGSHAVAVGPINGFSLSGR